jgi:hypothetical protein
MLRKSNYSAYNKQSSRLRDGGGCAVWVGIPSLYSEVAPNLHQAGGAGHKENPETISGFWVFECS